MDIAEFLLARIAEDEAAAREVAKASPGAWAALPVGLLGLSRHMSHVNFLAECEAKRRIVALHQPLDAWDEGQCGACSGRANLYPCATLRLLAAPYAEHPDYDPAWSVLASA